MGALTLKTYPFELRGWEIQKLKSFDPTDSFICSTLVYLNKNNIVQIEPVYNFYDNNWLNDKARHFFDTFFDIYSNNNKIKTNWLKLYTKILIKIYIFEHCSRQISCNYFFTVIFDYLSIELLGLLIFISKNYSFVKLKQVQSFKNINTDFESHFQINSLVNIKTLINSSFCLLVATNPRYEGNILNLTLRQRILKKNFKCILIGSVVHLMFPVLFFGTNTNIIRTITEGNNFICQNVTYSVNPFLVYNTELFKRTDSKTIIGVLKMLFYIKHFNNMWCGYNILSLSISEAGTLMLNQTTKLTVTDLNNFSLIYFINVNVCKINHIKKIMELHLFKQQIFINRLDCLNFSDKKLILDQNYKKDLNLKLSHKIKADYLYIPTDTFYENNSTFINTEGFVKKTNKIIYKQKIKSNWHILRKLINYFKNKLIFFNKKNNQSIFVNLKRFYNFKSYINFNYCPIKKLAHLSCLLTNKNKKYIIANYKLNFKIKVTKFKATKLKYCINDFFNTNKDNYSSNSVVLAGCSRQIKFQLTNFF